MTRHRVDYNAWLRIGTELFGADMRQWKFRCVQCGHVQSGESVAARTPELAGKISDWITMSCEGRHVPGVGCNWTLGGLLHMHTLEIYTSGVFVPAFEFAHERAPAMIAAAAQTGFSRDIPEAPDADTDDWEKVWPDWVPAEIRTSVERFYGGRGDGPRQWSRYARENSAPPFGAEVELPRLTGGGERASGRFVFAWNNVGRLVTPDGKVAYVSFP